MKAQLTIGAGSLSSGLWVTFVDFDEGDIEEMFVGRDDAEYALMATAVERFIAVKRSEKAAKAADKYTQEA